MGEPMDRSNRFLASENLIQECLPKIDGCFHRIGRDRKGNGLFNWRSVARRADIRAETPSARWAGTVQQSLLQPGQLRNRLGYFPDVPRKYQLKRVQACMSR